MNFAPSKAMHVLLMFFHPTSVSTVRVYLYMQMSSFQEHTQKSHLLVKSNKFRFGTQLTQSTIEYVL